MSEAKKVVLVMGDDWEGLYVDGQLQAEGHSLSPMRVLRALGNSLDPMLLNAEGVIADDEWLSDVGTLPMALSDVKLADRTGS